MPSNNNNINSNVPNPISDPSHHDRTNPASPYYNPALAAGSITTNIDTTIISSTNSTSKTNSTDVDQNKTKKVVQGHRERRHMRAMEDAQQASILAQQQVNQKKVGDIKEK